MVEIGANSLNGAGHPVEHDPSRRRVRSAAWAPNSRVVSITVLMRTSLQAEQLAKELQKPSRRHSKTLLDTLARIADASEPRKRMGYLQPEVPRSVYEEFRAIGLHVGRRGAANLLRSYLERWVDPATGQRRPKRNGRGRIRPHDSEWFKQKGTELITHATRASEGKVRYPFDAKESKSGIIELARAMNMTVSEFFSALMFRICKEHAGAHKV